MSRIPSVDRETADSRTSALLDTVEKQMGMVPNIVATMAQSTAVANAYLGFSGALASGCLSSRLREQIALVVAESNDCDYCLAAHTALATGAGLSESEAAEARRGNGADAKESAAIVFAQKIVRNRARVSDEDVQSVREAGFGDGEIAEIVAAVCLNLFTNYFNHVAQTDVDFPHAPPLAAVQDQ